MKTKKKKKIQKLSNNYKKGEMRNVPDIEG